MDVKDSLAKQIEKSKGDVTIMFTDIEGSTAFWEKHGDTAGRLMVDLHNRLMFAVVKSYKGTVIKTIGDSIMATFRSPGDGVRAAISMQQELMSRKRIQKDLKIRIRIGIHTGQAIIEKKDVYGDAVNTAARVEGLAEGGEIIISKATAEALGDERRRFYLVKRGSFVPKGKKDPLPVYACNWSRHKKLTGNIKAEPFLPVPSGQILELLLYLLVGLAAVYVIASAYIFYLFADFEIVALTFLNPSVATIIVSVVLIAGGSIALFALALRKVKYLSPFFLKLLKGVFGFGVGFLVVFGLSRMLPGDLARPWDGVVYASDHLFVEVLRDDVEVVSAPRPGARTIDTVDAGTVFLQNRLVRRHGFAWTRILYEQDRYAYILKQTKPRLGVPALKLTAADKFYFRWYDLYALLLGLAGFFWGFVTFQIRPT